MEHVEQHDQQEPDDHPQRAVSPEIIHVLNSIFPQQTKEMPNPLPEEIHYPAAAAKAKAAGDKPWAGLNSAV